MKRRAAALVAAATLMLLAVAPTAVPTGHRALAADRGLVVIAQTRYRAIPDEARIQVTIDAVATSYTPNTATDIYYYTGTSITAQPGATNFSATADGVRLHVATAEKTADYISFEITFGAPIYYQHAYHFIVSYDLPDPGGAPNRNVRVGRSIVAFPVWAFGSEGEPGGSVQVLLPAGFTADVQGDPMTQTTGADGGIVLSALSIPDPYAFVAYVSADRPGAFTETRFPVTIASEEKPVWVRSWEDDPSWGRRLTDLMTRGLPALQELIGLDYPVVGTLKVEEAAFSRLGEYAGVYNPTTELIRVRYDADAYVALHEASHIWFNDKLLQGRWIGEAWAEFYGVQAATAIGATGEAFDLTNDLLANKIPLNDWGAIGTVDASEYYAYAASYHVALLIFARTDLAGLRHVWAAVDGAEMAYQPANAGGHPETGVSALQPGWQQLLDLLDERTGAAYDDLWTEWVVDAAQQPLMAERSTARKDYQAVATQAAAWNLPRQLRLDMGAWKFADAEKEIAVARDVLAARGRIISEAEALGFRAPATLRQSFEGAAVGALDAAKREATDELAALGHLSAAAKAVSVEPDLFESIGMIGEDPAANLAAAGAAFQAGDLRSATESADRAEGTRAGAEAAGQLRAGGAGGIVVLVAGGSFLMGRVRRRRGATPDLPRGAAAEPPPAEPAEAAPDVPPDGSA